MGLYECRQRSVPGNSGLEWWVGLTTIRSRLNSKRYRANLVVLKCFSKLTSFLSTKARLFFSGMVFEFP